MFLLIIIIIIVTITTMHHRCTFPGDDCAPYFAGTAAPVLDVDRVAVDKLKSTEVFRFGQYSVACDAAVSLTALGLCTQPPNVVLAVSRGSLNGKDDMRNVV